jgi:hypothetical protein
MTPIEIYAAFGTIVVSVLGGMIVASARAGRMDARMAALEEIIKTKVGLPEWQLFLQELRDRLTRIETKLDRERK